jgi:hypothetical protein
MRRSTGFGPHRLRQLTRNAGFSSKNLKRLFPTDQSMVVVIDDRSDVWGDIPNLVKVVPCERHTEVPSSYLRTTADHSTTDHSKCAVLTLRRRLLRRYRRHQLVVSTSQAIPSSRRDPSRRTSCPRYVGRHRFAYFGIIRRLHSTADNARGVGRG